MNSQWISMREALDIYQEKMNQRMTLAELGNLIKAKSVVGNSQGQVNLESLNSYIKSLREEREYRGGSGYTRDRG